jgi:hypothetical protein
MEARHAGQGETMRDPDEDKSTETTPLDLDEGLEGDEGVVIQQQNVGKDNMRGGGEWPDPDTPPSDAAPGSLEE